MSRLVLIAVLLLTILLGSTALVLYLAYGINTSPPRKEHVDGLDAPALIQWSPHGSVRIEAESTPDFLFSLGYAHGMNRTWISLLSRQIALGRLSEWFGQETFPVDRLAHRLAFASSARSSFDALPLDVQTRYKRYAEGVTKALNTPRIRRLSALVLLEIEPENWEPWHALAVERLWGWLAVSSEELPDEIAGVPALLESDRALRSQLHLYGMPDNMVMVAGGGAGMRHLFRYVTGDSGQPVFQEFEYASSQGPVLDGISIPGTFAVPAGRTEQMSWTYLLRSAVSVDTVQVEPETRSVVTHSRIRDRMGTEDVVRIVSWDGHLVIHDASPDDSVVTILQWSGLGRNGDATAWSNLIDGLEPSFSIMENDGIVVRTSSDPVVTGNPESVFQHPSGIRFATNAISGSAMVDRLQEIISGQTDVQSDWDILHDTFSSEAATLIRRFTAAVDSLRSRTVREDVAVDYLRNWDLSYRGSSIAASILENATAYLTRSGSQVDSLSPELAGKALDYAVARLTELYGSDMREWRWEMVQDLTVYYPGWSEPDEADDYLVRQFKDEFVPVSVAGRGHPSTLAWGPSENRTWRKAPSAWEGIFGRAPGSTIEFERPSVAYTSFLGRFLAENRTTVNVRMDHAGSPSHETELLPVK